MVYRIVQKQDCCYSGKPYFIIQKRIFGLWVNYEPSGYDEWSTLDINEAKEKINYLKKKEEKEALHTSKVIEEIE
jgi:hypothetical protein